ncbi:hypothetical protein [Leptospira adleri]
MIRRSWSTPFKRTGNVIWSFRTNGWVRWMSSSEKTFVLKL